MTSLGHSVSSSESEIIFYQNYSTVSVCEWELLCSKLINQTVNKTKEERLPTSPETDHEKEYQCLMCSRIAKLHESLLSELAKEDHVNDECNPWNAHKKRKLTDDRIAFCYQKFENNLHPWYLTKETTLNEIPFLGRSYCIPKFIISAAPGEFKQRDFKRFIEQQAYIFYVDLRFGTFNEHLKTLKSIRKALYMANDLLGMENEVAVAIEINGFQAVTGGLKCRNSVKLETMETINLSCDRKLSLCGDEKCVYVNFSNYYLKLKKNDVICIGNDIRLSVVYRSHLSVKCVILQGGKLEKGMKVLLPQRVCEKYDEITQEQHDDIDFAFQNGANYIVCQEERYQKKLCGYIHWIIATSKKNKLLFAKINPMKTLNSQDVHLISKVFSGIWIDGDQGGDICSVNKELIQKCINSSKPIVISGKFLATCHVKLPDDEETMKNFALYPDALVIESKVFNNIDIKAIRKAFVENFPEINRICFDYCCNRLMNKSQSLSPSNIVLKNTIFASIMNKASCIITVNNSGRLPSLISSYRPVMPVYATIRNDKTVQNLLIYRNIYPLIFYDPVVLHWKDEVDERINYAVDIAERFGKIDRTTPFIVYFDSKPCLSISDSYRVLKTQF